MLNVGMTHLKTQNIGFKASKQKVEEAIKSTKAYGGDEAKFTKHSFENLKNLLEKEEKIGNYLEMNKTMVNAKEIGIKRIQTGRLQEGVQILVNTGRLLETVIRPAIIRGENSGNKGFKNFYQ